MIRRALSTALATLAGRILPAVVTALGVTLVGAGLLTYLTPTAAGGPGPSPSPTPSVSAGPSPSLDPSDPGSPSPSASPSASPGERVATRIVIPALRIDLPVVTPPGGPDAYPLCNVAMYIQELSQPGEPGATYIYAHARVGMFLPLLEESKRNNGQRMLGMLVQVYTSDDQLFLYEITEVRRHQTTLDAAFAVRDEQLWLQTSEGPRGTKEKLQVVALPIGSMPADHDQAHPTPKPVVCS
ncbi:MAG TPA: sortase [Candidatus Binatia bacterium]|nr:sortase [Candidatus Binatia bacterium]